MALELHVLLISGLGLGVTSVTLFYILALYRSSQRVEKHVDKIIDDYMKK